MPEQSHISSAPQVADYGLIHSKDARNAAGISSSDYVDDYNASRLAQYNNDFNIWKTQWEAEYNSPTAQRARLEAAGLNPNFNSIDGTGNISAEGSKASGAYKIGGNRNGRVSNILTGVNTLLNAVNEGVDTVSKISGIPKNISGYRQLLSDSLSRSVEGKQIQNFVGKLDQYVKEEQYNWLRWSHGLADSDGAFSTFRDSPAGRALYANVENQELLGALRTVQKNYQEIMQNPEYAEQLLEHIMRLWPYEEGIASGKSAVSQFQGDTVEMQTGIGFLLRLLSLAL